MRGRLRLAGIGLALAGTMATASSMTSMPGEMPESRPWSEAQAIIDSVEGARPQAGAMTFRGQGQVYYVAADGRLAMMYERDDADTDTSDPHEESFDPALLPAALGRFETQGPWVSLQLDQVAYRSEAARLAAQRELMEAYDVETEAELAVAFAKMRESMAEDEEAEDDEARADADAAATSRFLRVPFRSGELLVAEESLLWIAKGWDGQGPLKVMATAWRLPAAEVPASEYGFPAFEIANPLSAGLPIELTGLLRRDAIEGRVVEVIDSYETLKWENHEATVRVRLDRGANHGMYAGMDVYGLPPDEAFFASVTELKGETSVAELPVSRFSPKLLPQLPTVGLRVSTRRAAGVGCHVDTSAAVRGKVLAVAEPTQRLKWDAEGFAWVTMTIDQGSRHGLATGDEVQGEANEIDGEGLVTAIEPERATVLWRLQRYDELQELRLPAVGEALVTAAWKRAEWDTFGSATE